MALMMPSPSRQLFTGQQKGNNVFQQPQSLWNKPPGPSNPSPQSSGPSTGGMQGPSPPAPQTNRDLFATDSRFSGFRGGMPQPGGNEPLPGYAKQLPVQMGGQMNGPMAGGPDPWGGGGPPIQDGNRSWLPTPPGNPWDTMPVPRPPQPIPGRDIIPGEQWDVTTASPEELQAFTGLQQLGIDPFQLTMGGGEGINWDWIEKVGGRSDQVWEWINALGKYRDEGTSRVAAGSQVGG